MAALSEPGYYTQLHHKQLQLNKVKERNYYTNFKK